MGFRQVIEKRRTTRQFTSVPVGRKTIERIIKAGLMAPSFDHARKWNFVILDDAEAKTAAIECIKPLPCAIDKPTTPIAEMIKIAFPKQHSMFAEAPCVALPLSSLLMVACGLCISVMFGGIFNLATDGLGRLVPVASGITMSLVSGGALLADIGVVTDRFGILSSCWVFAGFLAYILFFAVCGSRSGRLSMSIDLQWGGEGNTWRQRNC